MYIGAQVPELVCLSSPIPKREPTFLQLRELLAVGLSGYSNESKLGLSFASSFSFPSKAATRGARPSMELLRA